MNRIALLLRALIGVLGLSFTLTVAAPPLPAAASATKVIICNSATVYYLPMRVYNVNWPDGYVVNPGVCGTWDRAGIKVRFFGTPPLTATSWRVRSVPGEYGSCWASMWSYPGSKDRYEYRLYGGNNCS